MLSFLYPLKTLENLHFQPSSTKHHPINIWKLILAQHWHWMVTSIQNTNIDIPVFTYCGTVNLNLSRTSLGKHNRIHEQAVGIITKTNTVKLTPIMTYLNVMLARSSEHLSQGSYQHLRLSISNCYHTQSQQKTISSR